MGMSFYFYFKEGTYRGKGGREHKQHKRNGRSGSNSNLCEFVIIIVVYKKNTYFMSGAVVNAWDNETCGRGQKLH